MVKLKMRVKYSDYKLGRSDVTIVGEEPLSGEPKPSPTPKKP
jgi:hypothetical protein